MTLPLILLAVHYVADFVLQTNWQASNKSKNWNALLRHTTVYSLCFIPFWLSMTLPWIDIAGFVLITFVTHTLTDAVTSRISAYYWRKQRPHAFFVVIGADQLIHYYTLGVTFIWVVG